MHVGPAPADVSPASCSQHNHAPTGVAARQLSTGDLHSKHVRLETPLPGSLNDRGSKRTGRTLNGQRCYSHLRESG
jgi:hypothetical protein